MEDEDQRRRSKRKGYVSFIWYRLIADDADEAANEGIAHSTDLSPDGLGIIAPRPMAVGRKVFMKIKAPTGTISAVAVVVNTQERDNETYRIGFEFEIVAPSDMPILRRMVEP
ncbi:MAG: hypothetical protein DRJ42_23325 [Deltaproteobacteria bacterium]|nr:MAG: hypothetical protein DRJ42_23325 [Deltaproteobacteria bacterium]